MAQSIDILYKQILFIARKNQSSSLSAEQFNLLWNQEQSAYQSDLLGRWQRMNNGKEGNNTGLIEDETILTKLTPFTAKATLTITTGASTKPAGLIYTLALRINNAKVFKINQNEVWSIFEDVIDPPSIPNNSYYYVEYGNQYDFYPSTVTAANLDYIVAPTDVVWGFTYDGNNRQVYDAGTSVQSQWDANSNIEISRRCLKTLGVSLKDKDFEAYGNNQINTGD